MMKLDEIQKRLLLEVADLHEIPEGAYNIRSNSQSAGRQSTANIEITSKQEVSGLEVRIKPGTKRESVHIPVVMTESGLKEVVYNDFFVGADADVVIVAGCGIDNCGNQDSQHDGIHRFYLEKGAKVPCLELVLEMNMRGIRFLPVDLYRSDVRKFLIEDGNIRCPFISLPGLGESAAVPIVEARKERPFISIEDLQTRGRVGSSIIDLLRLHGALDGLSETNQISMF